MRSIPISAYKKTSGDPGRPNGPVIPQPRVTPWVTGWRRQSCGLKGPRYSSRPCCMRSLDVAWPIIAPRWGAIGGWGRNPGRWPGLMDLGPLARTYRRGFVSYRGLALRYTAKMMAAPLFSALAENTDPRVTRERSKAFRNQSPSTLSIQASAGMPRGAMRATE